MRDLSKLNKKELVKMWKEAGFEGRPPNKADIIRMLEGEEVAEVAEEERAEDVSTEVSGVGMVVMMALRTGNVRIGPNRYEAKKNNPLSVREDHLRNLRGKGIV